MFAYNELIGFSAYDIRGNRRQNDFNYTIWFYLGGPIIKDKLHFFVAWDHQQDSRPLIVADVQSQKTSLGLM
jgi:hypothetical protein